MKNKYLERITEDFQVLSKVTLKQISLATQLVEDNRNAEIEAEINNNERIIDSLEVKMRDEVINAIVLYSPRAGELRKIMAYYDMTTYLERIGDLLLNVAGFLKKIAVHEAVFASFKEDISKLIAVAESMTQNAIFAFTCEDSELAKATIELDDRADELHHRIVRRLRTCFPERVATEQEMTDALCICSMSYNIERIGDNATNIAEAAIYLMEGRNIKHYRAEETPALKAGSEG